MSFPTDPPLPTEAGKAFPSTDVRYWMHDDERAVYTAACCRDLTSAVEVSVSLPEFRGKRRPKNPTPEQVEREDKAGELLPDYAKACNPAVAIVLFRRLASARMHGAKVPA